MEIIGINIKARREEKNMTLRDMAEKLGVSASFLSQVETGKASPSLSTLKRISGILQTTIGELIGENLKAPRHPVVRNEERQSIRNIGDGIDIYLLSSPDTNNQMEPLLFRFNENAHSGESSYRHFGQEFVIVIKGSMEIDLNDNKYLLNKGDSIYFNSSVPHSFRNTAKGETEAIWVVTPPSF
jgi:transcriptional regulator with XRE-family HTH domain